MAKQDSIPPPGSFETPERFHDTDRSFRVHKLSGLIVEVHPDKPTVGVLPNGKRLVKAPDESHKDFIDRCEAQISTRPAI